MMLYLIMIHTTEPYNLVIISLSETFALLMIGVHKVIYHFSGVDCEMRGWGLEQYGALP